MLPSFPYMKDNTRVESLRMARATISNISLQCSLQSRGTPAGLGKLGIPSSPTRNLSDLTSRFSTSRTAYKYSSSFLLSATPSFFCSPVASSRTKSKTLFRLSILSARFFPSLTLSPLPNKRSKIADGSISLANGLVSLRQAKLLE